MIDGQEIPVTVSIGAVHASFPNPGRVATVMKAADAALYKAKAQGRNQVVLADDHFGESRAPLAQRKVG